MRLKLEYFILSLDLEVKQKKLRAVIVKFMKYEYDEKNTVNVVVKYHPSDGVANITGQLDRLVTVIQKFQRF